MLADVRRVYVIQEKGTGLFLSEECFPVRSFSLAGRAPTREEAEDTARMNLKGVDFEIHTFLEVRV